jgi:hypothetical protein
MDPELKHVLEGLQEAAAFAKSYRFDLTDEYVALIEQVENLPQNRPGADKSGRWLGSRADLRAQLAGVRRLRRTP